MEDKIKLITWNTALKIDIIEKMRIFEEKKSSGKQGSEVNYSSNYFSLNFFKISSFNQNVIV